MHISFRLFPKTSDNRDSLSFLLLHSFLREFARAAVRLALFAWITVAFLEAASVKIPVVRYKGVEWIRLSSLSKWGGDVRVRAEPFKPVYEIQYGKHKVRIQEGKPFYIHDREQFSVSHAPIFRGKDLLIPVEMLEELMSELRMPVHYQITEKEVSIKKRVKVTPSKLRFILLDPGHGGKDPGASGLYGARENKITLKTALSLRAYLRKKFPDLKIFLSRETNRFVSLEARAALANRLLKRYKNGIFISLHCNSTLSRKAHGYELYYLARNATNEEARRVKIRENADSADPWMVKKLESILLDSEIQADSKVLVRAIRKGFMSSLDGRVSGRGIRKADFAVLRGSLMPAVLVEMGYISNPKEAIYLQSADFRRRLAKGIEKGIRRYRREIEKLK